MYIEFVKYYDKKLKNDWAFGINMNEVIMYKLLPAYEKDKYAIDITLKSGKIRIVGPQKDIIKIVLDVKEAFIDEKKQFCSVDLPDSVDVPTITNS